MAETKFIKTKKDRNYTVLDNTFIQDTRLSWKAKGLMTYLLSLPDDWCVNFSEVLRHASDGRGSLRGAIKELKEHGYLVSKRLFDDKSKKIIGFTYEVIENPYVDKSTTEGKNHTTEKPTDGKSNEWKNLPMENPTLLNTNIQSTNNNKLLNKQNTNITNIPAKPNSDFKIVIDTYFQNFKKLYEEGMVQNSEPIVSMKQAGQMIKNLLEKQGKENLIAAINKAMNDNWIVGQGYSLTTILSATQLNKLLNGKNQQNNYSGYQQKVFDKSNLENKDFWGE